MLVEVENCQNVVPSIKETLKHARRKSSDSCWMGICFRHLLVGVLARCSNELFSAVTLYYISLLADMLHV